MRNYKTWFLTAIVLQFITAALHSLSFFNTPVPQNDQEKLLFDLMRNYRQDLGGMRVSTEELMLALSACFALLYLFGGLVNLFLLRKSQDLALHRGLLWINVVVFGICFAVMAKFTFPPPIVLTGLVWLFLGVALITNRLHR